MQRNSYYRNRASGSVGADTDADGYAATVATHLPFGAASRARVWDNAIFSLHDLDLLQTTFKVALKMRSITHN